MPLYDYACPNGHLKEALRKHRDRQEPLACAQCDQDAVYQGMPASNIGTHRPFAAHYEDGRRVVGTLGSAPRKRPVTSK